MKVGLRTVRSKGVRLCAAAVAMSLMTCSILSSQPAAAAQLNQRSLRIADVTVGAATTHIFSFTHTTSDTAVGSVVFEYCTSPLFDFTCDAPTGVDASGATLIDQTGETGYSLQSAQSNKIVLTRTAAEPTAPTTYSFDGIVNPTGAPETFYVRISTYASEDGTGPYIDFGAVVNTTTQGVQVSSEVPPYLKFCVGLTITDDCSTAEGNVIDLGELRTTVASSGSSQMMAATNAEFGLAIAVYGTTMTSGINEIPALKTPTINAPGNAQFGINLRNNADPDVGDDPAGVGIANPAAKYDTPDRYAFSSGDIVATSPNVTDTRKFTVSYLTNISPAQPPGVYTATLTYICTATF